MGYHLGTSTPATPRLVSAFGQTRLTGPICRSAKKIARSHYQYHAVVHVAQPVQLALSSANVPLISSRADVRTRIVHAMERANALPMVATGMAPGAVQSAIIHVDLPSLRSMPTKMPMSCSVTTLGGRP